MDRVARCANSRRRMTTNSSGLRSDDRAITMRSVTGDGDRTFPRGNSSPTPSSPQAAPGPTCAQFEHELLPIPISKAKRSQHWRGATPFRHRLGKRAPHIQRRTSPQFEIDESDQHEGPSPDPREGGGEAPYFDIAQTKNGLRTSESSPRIRPSRERRPNSSSGGSGNANVNTSGSASERKRKRERERQQPAAAFPRVWTIIQRLAQDQDEEVRRSLAFQFNNISKLPQLLPIAQHMAERDPSSEVRNDAMGAMATLMPPEQAICLLPLPHAARPGRRKHDVGGPERRPPSPRASAGQTAPHAHRPVPVPERRGRGA